MGSHTPVMCGIGDITTYLGCCVQALNCHSDAVLRGLRDAGGGRGYKIPHGGGFEWVSGANFLGEIVEWVGFALASWSLPGARAVLLATGSNGAPISTPKPALSCERGSEAILYRNHDALLAACTRQRSPLRYAPRSMWGHARSSITGGIWRSSRMSTPDSAEH
jgi:hypothetical protein